MVSSLELIPLLGLPMVEPGDDIARLIADGISANGLSLVEGDVVVIAQKIISKAEDRYRLLSEVVVSQWLRAGKCWYRSLQYRQQS